MDRQNRAAYYFEAQAILVKDLPYFWLYEPKGSSAYRDGLQGMYAWSAKSNIYFAQDAWWEKGGRSSHIGSGMPARRNLYLLIALVVLVSLAVAAVTLKRRKRKG